MQTYEKLIKIMSKVRKDGVQHEKTIYIYHFFPTYFKWGKASGGAFMDCKNLKYLEWEVSGTPDVSFLNELPKLYAFCLYGEEENEQESLKRQDLFTESSWPQIKCLVVDRKWLRS